MTEAQIKDTISTLPSLSDDVLVHYYKCASSNDSAKAKKLLAPLMTAIEKERKKRGSASTLSSKPLAVSTSEIAKDY